jgi:glycosyltransferase involved in cell wall biosynthesis
MPNEIPFFSIILPVFNREKYIGKALDSLQSQKFQNFETIIVDDCSSDNSFDICKSHPLKNKIILRNEKNSERCFSRNKGIEVASGKYICFLDSDDYHLENHLSLLFKAIEENEFPKAVFFTNAWDENLNVEKLERICPRLDSSKIFTYLLRYTPNPQRWAIHKDLLIEKNFDPEIVICEDLDLILRMAADNIPIIQVSERTTVYVASPDSFTHGDSNKAEKELRYYKRIFSKIELKGKLPRKECNRLLSKCYYFLSLKYFEKNNNLCLKFALLSIYLYPKGYNGNTNKIILTNITYSIPILGNLFKFLYRKWK